MGPADQRENSATRWTAMVQRAVAAAPTLVTGGEKKVPV
jgi:hypothetical protein